MALWRQSLAVFKIYLQDGLAYRASGMIWVLTDVVSAVTLPLVWLTAAGSGTIRGFSGADFVAYYMIMVLVSNFITCHFMWEINGEIREGQLSSQLLRPMPWLPFMFMRNLTWRFLRVGLFLPWFLIFLIAYGQIMSGVQFHFGWEFFLAVFLGHCLSFLVAMALSTLALFTEEAQSIFELYYFPMLFLSGQLFPVSILPEWAQMLAKLFPFFYMTGAPTEIALGQMSQAEVHGVLIGQIVWIAIACGLFKFSWPRGLKRYNGVGL